MNTTESGAAEYLRRYREILDTMIDEMTNAQLGCSISQNFIMQMIPHHRAAIEMSRNLLEHSRFRPVRCIAENIITSQTKSIENMQSALECCSQVKNCSQELCGYQRRFRDITGIMFEQMKGSCTTGCIAADFMPGDDTSSPRRGSHVRERSAISAVQGASPDTGRYNLLADLRDT